MHAPDWTLSLFDDFFFILGERKLTKSILNFNKWEKGQTDLCEFVFADLGEIEFVTIGLYHLQRS